MDKAKIEELRKAAKRAAEAMKWRATGAYPVTYSADPETMLALLDHIDSLTAERDALAAKLAELERQEPVAWDCGGEYLTKSLHQAQWHEKTHGCATPLYSRPVPAAPAAPATEKAKPAPTGRMMFWAADPTEDQLMQDDEESIAEYFAQNMRGDVIEVKVGRAVELEPRMMRVYAPTDDESLPRWEWLP